MVGQKEVEIALLKSQPSRGQAFWRGRRCALGWAAGPSADRELGDCGAGSRCALAWPGSCRAAGRDHPAQRPGQRVHELRLATAGCFSDDGLRVSYPERGAKGNPWIESLWGRMKTEAGSQIVEAQALPEPDRRHRRTFPLLQPSAASFRDRLRASLGVPCQCAEPP